MRRLREMYDRIQRCLPDPPDNRLPLVREAQAAISRWEAVEPAARAWLDEIRETALRYRTSREVVHTYRGSQPRRGRHIQLIARGDIHDDSR
jgi:hypothetical protein